ncbi:Ovate family protein 14 [Dorcoceras hygrometricum]|uniref:Transcription repressor n=1 Tax=Dorcoceras hygrometricum TaxID=472368 RepID=A0A2Z7CLD4_9LAMI|nr:Ovate family protein 14 [Dorcoceras hygrometricum]
MSKQIHKSVQQCLSKIKISNKQIHIRFRRCTNPRTPSFDFDRRRGRGDAVTLSDIDKFLFDNFRSLYLQEEPEEGARWANVKTRTSFLLECPELQDPPPPENLCSSDRFFVASGSSSSLIMDDKSSVADNESDDIAEEEGEAPDDFIVIFTHSPSPYEDFRRSMKEMVEARVEQSGKVDWGFLEELLFCYLDLNDKKSYRYILHAFVDLIVVLREKAANIPASRRTRNDRGGTRLKL